MLNNKLKIIYLSDDYPPESPGGAGMIVHEEAVAMAKLGHEVLVITTTTNNTSEKIEEGVRIIRLHSQYHPRLRSFVSLWNWRLVSEIKKILQKENPDVTHIHNMHTHISYKVFAVARIHSKKVFHTAHDAMSVHFGKFMPKTEGDLKAGGMRNFKDYGFRINPFRKSIIRHYMEKTDAIFSVSGALKDLLVANGISNIHVLHNGIDSSRWENVDEAKKNEYISKLGLQNKKVILFAGRISGLKGGRVIEEAFKKIYSSESDTRLLVVGKEGEPKEGIVYTGTVPRDEMKYMYAISDVVVVPSLYLDPFPTINLEAMASRKPVVGTSLGGTKEAVLHGETGYIVDPNNIEFISQKILDLLLNSDVGTQMGGRGYERFVTHFTTKIHTDKLLSWYNSRSN
jgi:glycosyltransferase involved in cell wall biosynthesis